MRKARLQHTTLLLFATIAFCAVSAECRASAQPASASASAPCHASAPAAPDPAPAPEGPPCGSLSANPCCDAPWSLSSGTASGVPAPPLLAIAAAAPQVRPPAGLGIAVESVPARAAPPLALYTILRL